VHSVLALARASLLFVALVALLSTSTGCGLIGMGVGSAVGGTMPRYSKVEPNAPPLLAGSEIRVFAASPGGTEELLEGEYEGVRYGKLIVSTIDPVYGVQTGERAVPLEAIREVRVRNGTYAGKGLLTGLAIGGAIDLTLIVIAGSACAGTSGGCHFGQTR
jgi:hypothetical protein